MKKSNLSLIAINKINSMFILLIILILYFPSQAMAERGSVQNFYMQLGLGVGLGLESYPTQETDTATANDIAIHFTARGHVGISNIMEIEWQHQFASKTSALDNYGFDFLLYKLNPFPGDYNTDSEPFYLVFGKGELNYNLENGAEWQGDSKVVGMEWAIMSYRQTYRIGLKHITTKGVSPSPTSADSKMLLIDFSVAIGY